jgi:hypothetical protein
MESPITIADADRPIGTHVFTAMERSNGDTDMRWSVVSLDNRRPRRGGVQPDGRLREHGNVVGLTASVAANAALDRIVVPQDALDRISGMVLPRSSQIISEEELSAETGKGTDFIVLLSGEPQGSINVRRRGPRAASDEWRPQSRASYSIR